MNNLRKTHQAIKQAWSGAGDGWQPLTALSRASQTHWVVDGVIPASSIVWVSGNPATFKSFILLDIGVHVAAGTPWQNRRCEQATVIYVAAEGGNNLEIRRAAAELAAGQQGPLLIKQTRPRIDTGEGLLELMSLVQAATSTDSDNGIHFDIVNEAESAVYAAGESPEESKYLEQEEKELIISADEWRELKDRKGAGERLSPGELRKLEELSREIDEKRRKFGIPDSTQSGAAIADNRRLAELESKLLAMDEFTPTEKSELEKLANWREQRSCKTQGLFDWCVWIAANRLPPRLKSAHKYLSDEHYVAPFEDKASKNVLLIIDTYSQTSSGDNKDAVGPYMKNLRELADQVEKAGGSISIIVIDHMTKSGDTYMGATAKQGDSDAMIEITRHGQLVEMSCPDKMKDAEPFSPIHLEMVPFCLEGFTDGQGRPITSLVVTNGERTHKLRKAAGKSEESSNSIVLGLLADQEDQSLAALREQYLANPFNEDKKPETAKRAFLRTIESLVDSETITVTDGIVSYSLI